MIKKYMKPIVIFCLVVATILVALALGNLHKSTFWEASLVDLITLVIAIVLSFFITQVIDDDKRRKQCIEDVILEIQSMVGDERCYSVCGRQALLKQQSCANKIKYLKEAGFKDIAKDIDFIENEFCEIRDLYSEHNKSEKDLAGIQKDIDRHVDGIYDKCDKIRIALYK